MRPCRRGSRRSGPLTSVPPRAHVRERAPAKVNLLLHVGPRRGDGLHELCSLFASLDLADEILVVESGTGEDAVICPGVVAPNICDTALRAFRSATEEGSRAPRSASASAARASASTRDRASAFTPARASEPRRLPPVEVRVEKRIPVGAGLGGGSADAAAVLRAANELAGRPLDTEALQEVAIGLGADVPSQVDPRHALVRGAGELVDPVGLPPMFLVLVPLARGLSTAAVYREADRLGTTRDELDAEAVGALAALPLTALAGSLENDLQAAAMSLRPEIGEGIAGLRGAGAVAALMTGSGPTVFGVFEREHEARDAAARLPEAIVAAVA